MSDSSDSDVQDKLEIKSVLVLSQTAVERCHIILPDMPRPTGAITYNGQYYGYVKFFPTLEAAQRGADRLIDKGNAVVLTQVPKGLVLWVHEPEAERAAKATSS